jgi:NTP pyrophosphatase (non-canonical NTP hydrolase)
MEKLTKLSEIQKYVAEWIEKVGEKDWHKWNYFSRLVEEVGEVGEILSIREGHKKHKKAGKKRLEEEIGDILFVLAALANKLGINLEKAFMECRKKLKRDFGDID